MREIKFRVWNKKGKLFSKGDLLITRDGEIGFMYWGVKNLDDSFVSLDDNFVVQQYTGLKDKNGVEIYEGDLLVTKFFKPQENPTEVFWADAHSSWGVYAKNGQVGPLLNMHQEHHEVVGNIFEQLNLSDYQNECI